MADNYLENRYDELFSGETSKSRKIKYKGAVNLNSLLLKNRSYRGYDQNYVVSEAELMKIISVNNKIPSAKNQQVLRFKLITKGSDADIVLNNIKFAGALPQLNLPFKGYAPEAFIIICTKVQETKWVDIDLGISAQSMLLQAVEMGLSGICIGAFNKAEIINAFNLSLEPVMIIAIGKGVEKIQLLSIKEDENHNYFRENGVHFVPKVEIDDLIIR